MIGGLDPANVTFEITETAALTNLDAARQFVETLAEGVEDTATLGLLRAYGVD